MFLISLRGFSVKSAYVRFSLIITINVLHDDVLHAIVCYMDKRDKLIHCRIKSVLYDALKEFADRRGESLSVVMRSALVKFIEDSRSLGN